MLGAPVLLNSAGRLPRKPFFVGWIAASLGVDALPILFHQRSFQKPDPFSTSVSKEVL